MNQDIFNQYIDERVKLDSVSPIAPYDWYTLESTLSIEWMVYSLFLQEHASELANSINEFSRHIASLMAWEKVLAGLYQDEKYNVIIEFVSPLATLALNMPYVIRSRFIYSVAHLSHQANQIKQKPWIDNLPIDSEIYFDVADNFGKHWKKYKKLKMALEKIADKTYRKSTYNFRDKYNHRYSPRIEIGLTGMVNRIKNENGKISYGFGYTNPLMLENINPLLSAQHLCCLAAYEKYQALVNEQVEEINVCMKSA